ncbi:hypothetical protein DOTSEDRAFT_24049 [Dothistroma septosporum NZE10]|uniref:BTB domain-containing protein n=1 Tax=Dothistroma septosporum (strain NZE10 / CBS 128990) TaxID=675120 RepID=N1PLN2_DOTSN|nr:hypothetical protein DOTSEDRAFT_24049 [Dothistroma septosporum NZE10]
MSTLTDFTITCHDREWRVHRVVLALHSEVLVKACAPDFEEAATGKIYLSSKREDVVATLVQFLYSFDYEYGTCDPQAASSPGHLEFHVVSLSRLINSTLNR